MLRNHPLRDVPSTPRACVPHMHESTSAPHLLIQPRAPRVVGLSFSSFRFVRRAEHVEHRLPAEQAVCFCQAPPGRRLMETKHSQKPRKRSLRGYACNRRLHALFHKEHSVRNGSAVGILTTYPVNRNETIRLARVKLLRGQAA